VGAVRGVLASMLRMLREGVTHLAVATDHVIESFRNDLWPEYKTSEGIDPELWGQFPVLESVLSAAGIVVWPMVEFEADDALASAAVIAANDKHVEQIVICTPDKDLSQCVSGMRVVQLDRRTGIVRDENGVIQKFGVLPESVPDYLALVGDSADGYPGLAGWGAKSTSAVLAKYRHLEQIPSNYLDWRVNIANVSSLAATLVRDWDRALLFRNLATLRTDISLFIDVDTLRWTGPRPEFDEIAQQLDAATSETNRIGRAKPTGSRNRSRAISNPIRP
jgi:5'-3' exonuclease